MYTTFGQNIAEFYDDNNFLTLGLYGFVRIWVKTKQFNITFNGKENSFP